MFLDYMYKAHEKIDESYFGSQQKNVFNKINNF